MTRDEFLAALQDVLQRDEDLTFSMALTDLREWDSLAVLATRVFLESKFGLLTSFEDYKEMKTVEDIARKAGL
jgi:acyl carrier protein